METIFRKGDRVFHIHYGWGTIKLVDSDVGEYSVGVIFDLEERCWFTHDGRELNGEKPTLSFTEYTLEGFSQERPEELPSRGDIVWIKEMDTKMYVPIVFMEAINDDYVLSFNFINIKVVNKDFVLTKNPYANEQ